MELENLLQNLNDAQKEAVQTIDGRIRIIAGAGSGKTRVLTSRYAFLHSILGVPQNNIICLTFTNKAANEMKKRISNLIDESVISPYICTIHSFCVKVLRQEITKLSLPQYFNIIDENDIRRIAKMVLGEYKDDDDEKSIGEFIESIVKYKAENSEAYIEYFLPNYKFDEKPTKIERFFQIQVKQFMIDYNDIIYFTLYLFNNYEKIKEKWASQFEYVMVDECQDCNVGDWELIEHLQSEHHNLFVVGDPDQAIYEWRGSRPKLFVDFAYDKEIILDANYRSTPEILNVANDIIEHNKIRVEKDLITDRESGKKVLWYHAESEEEEARYIVNDIAKKLSDGASFDEIAVLYRSGYLSRAIEQELLKRNLPYVIWGGIRFFERMEIKDTIAYLKLIAYPNDDIAFSRIINYPSRKFGDAKMNKLSFYAQQDGLSLYEALVKYVETEKAFSCVKNFVKIIEKYRKNQDEMSISDILDNVIAEAELKSASVKKDKNIDRFENVMELISSVKIYEQLHEGENITLKTYLNDIALYMNTDHINDENHIKLMTIHQAKGLEFKYVYVRGLTEGIFPHGKATSERENGIEEERRLMYVAVTRAQNELYLTEAEGFSWASEQKCPSRFLFEIRYDNLEKEGNIDPELIQGTCYQAMANGEEELDESNIEKILAHSMDKHTIQTNINNENDYIFEKNDWVYHDYFEAGHIVERNENGSYKVKFKTGTKNIMGKYLNLIE